MRHATASRHRWWDWWPLLLAPAALALAALCHWAGWSLPLAKGPHENLALFLTGAASGAFAARYRVERHPWHLLLTFLALVFFCREWHFQGTGVGVYVGIGVIVAVAVLFNARLLPALASRPFLVWLVCTGVTYVLSQLIARRVFREGRLPLLPWEAALHAGYEELTENVAHLMLVITALVGRWPRGRG